MEFGIIRVKAGLNTKAVEQGLLKANPDRINFLVRQMGNMIFENMKKID